MRWRRSLLLQGCGLFHSRVGDILLIHHILLFCCDIKTSPLLFLFASHRVKLGIVADIGTLQRISKLVGKGTAREMAFSGDPLPADRALACGLVTRVYSSVEELHKEALAFAEQCARNSPRALHGTKIVMNYADEHSTRDGLEQVALFNSAFLETSDIQEAVMAFMQKRSPIFPSRL